MKYLIYNDISYIFHKKKKILLCSFLLPLLIVFIYSHGEASSINIVKICVGANFDLKNFSIISLLMLLFNSFTFIYLILDIYTKDLDQYLENIFLRIKPQKYIIKKNITFLSLSIIIKAIQYSLIILLLFIFQKNILDLRILQLFVTDILYIAVLEYLFLFIYFIYILMKKNIYILIIMLSILLFFFPKTIWSTNKYTILFVTLLMVVHLLIISIFLKVPKKLIEEVYL